ncbi:uncharacterized protein [Dermacentor albipictus]|uniref:uncharacterized protein isoform X3 n=1 Tax=Dermacentor albipictus TaxID=60249 RepID=UPI0031FC3584
MAATGKAQPVAVQGGSSKESAGSATASPGAARPAAPGAASGAAPRHGHHGHGAEEDGSDDDDAADKQKRESADQAVLPTLLRIIRKKLGKRFKETRDLVMFVVVVLFAVVYLLISSKLILDHLELPGTCRYSSSAPKRAEPAGLNTAFSASTSPYSAPASSPGRHSSVFHANYNEKGSMPNASSTESSVLVITYPPQCIDPNGAIVCLPEAQYIDQHLTKEALCTNPYGSICNQNYFHSGENRGIGLWPYRYANLQYIYEVIKRVIKEEFNNFEARVDPVNETAVYKTLYFLKNCSTREDRRKVNVGHLKRVLAKVGLPSSPYSTANYETYEDVARILGNVMRNLDLKIFFAVDFVADSNSKADAPFGKKVVVRKVPYEAAVKERRRDNLATEKCEYTYCLLKTPQLLPPHERLYNYVTVEFYNFVFKILRENTKWTEEELKKSPTLAELQDATATKDASGTVTHAGFNWVLFFNTLLRHPSFKFTESTTVFVEDYDIIVNVMKLVQNFSRNIVLNYITTEVWSLIAPLLPLKYLHNLVYLPGTDFESLSHIRIRPNCFKLAEMFCPEGMAAVIKQKILRFPTKEGAAKWKKQKIRVAIMEQFDKDVEQLKCDAPIRNTSGQSFDDVTLYYFVDAVRTRKKQEWTARFTQRSSDFDKPLASNFAYAMHFMKNYLFVPLVYVAGILQRPDFKETYIIMSLVDAFKAIFRHLFEQRANDTARIRRGVPIISYIRQNATAIEDELRNSLNVTDPKVTKEHSWVWAEMLASRWFFHILDTELGALRNEEIHRGLPPQYKHWMRYILFAEAACRQYQEEPFWWNTIFVYGIPPNAEVNLALLDHKPFRTSFHCESK